MPAHKHAELMALYAQDAAETDKPGLRWEFREAGGRWFCCIKSPEWRLDHDYRRKPKTSRERFEEWANWAGYNVQHNGSHYDCVTTSCLLNAWQEAERQAKESE